MANGYSERRAVVGLAAVARRAVRLR